MNPLPAGGASVTVESTAERLRTVTVKGEIDIYNAELLDDALTQACENGSASIVDLRQCRYIDTSAIAVLVRCRNKTRSPIHIITRETGTVQRVLEITQLDNFFIVTADGP